MARRVAAGKPSLSDVVLADEDQILITNQIRAQFDSIAPKRPTKPSRSEPDSSPQNPPQEIASQQAIPELNKLLNLQSQSHLQGLHLGEGDSLLVQEEYVETQYYKELDSVEKRHHKVCSVSIFFLKLKFVGCLMKLIVFIELEIGAGSRRGSGFIQVGIEGGENESIETGFIDGANGRVHFHGGYKSNPATNDWLPKIGSDDHLIFKSQKLNRSEA